MSGGMDAARLRAAFPVLRETAYLNAGTCGPVPEAAVRAATEAWRLGADRGRSGAAYFERLIELKAGLRERFAALLSAAPEDVALTTGTSDGVGRVIAGLDLGPGDEVITADDEHPGLYGPLAAACAQRGVTVRAVPLGDVANAATGPAARLVACSHISWASGLAAPAELAALDIPVLLDGAQGVGAVPVDVRALGCAFYAGSGQKWLCGPVGTGMLYVAREWQDRVRAPAPAYANLDEPARGLDAGLAPGARRFDAGSLDLSVVVSSLAAHDVLAEPAWPAVHERATGLAARLAERLAQEGHEVVPRGASTLVAWATPGQDSAEAVLRLAGDGVVIREIPETGRLRASVGAWNDEDDLERLIAGLGRVRAGTRAA
jgi:L-cysteine/cystine lyase